MSLTLKFQLEFKSDYHIGAGYGLGTGIDSAIFRDADGVPGIRGTVLTGLLRDGLWQLLETKPFAAWREKTCKQGGNASSSQDYCGQYQQTDGVELCPICLIFGTPRAHKHWFVRSARPADKTIITIGEQNAKRQVVQRARINPRTRRAEDGKLFSQESGSQKEVFEFAIYCAADDDSTLDEAALLVAAARNVRELGRGRNRGYGECRFNLVELSGIDQLDDWQTYLLTERLPQQWFNGNQPHPRTPANKPPELARNIQPDAPLRVRLILRTDEPVLISQKAEAGNQFESKGWISGQTLRGALAWRAARNYEWNPTDPNYGIFVDTFLQGRVQYPDLYPAALVENKRLQTAIPAPRDLLTCKVAPGLKGHGVWFSTLGEEHEKCSFHFENSEEDKTYERTCDSPLKSVTQLLVLDNDRWQQTGEYTLETKSSTEMHIAIDPQTRRVKEGQLYGYVTLDAGQYFVGELLCKNAADWELLQDLADLKEKEALTLRIGKANRRGYGKVTAWFGAIDQKEPHPWRVVHLNERVTVGSLEMIFTLLTDTIIQDPWGRYSAGFDLDWLKGIFGENLKEIECPRARMGELDGFNSHLKLPRWRDLALLAGSTVKLIFHQPVDLQTLEDLEQNGIGLRRNEGFGQVVFNHPVYKHCEKLSYRLKLEKTMRLARVTAEPALKNYSVTLDKQKWGKCRNPRFTGVARWLHGHQGQSAADLKAMLDGFGDPDEGLKETIGDYGDRSKPNKLVGTDGLKLIEKMLHEAAELDPGDQTKAIQLLAGKVAAAADMDRS